MRDRRGDVGSSDQGISSAEAGSPVRAGCRHPVQFLIVGLDRCKVAARTKSCGGVALSLFYKLLYAIGFKPWERMPTSPAAHQVSAMLDLEEHANGPPFGAALDLGCGTGMWCVRLAQRGWDVTGVDIVPKAVRGAKERAQTAGVDVRFLEGSVAALRNAGVGPGFRLVLDFGTVHGLAPSDVKNVAREVSAVTTDDATLLMYASSPGRRGPLPRGLSREEVEDAYVGWRVVDEQPFDLSGTPAAFKKTEPRWFRLRRD